MSQHKETQWWAGRHKQELLCYLIVMQECAGVEAGARRLQDEDIAEVNRQPLLQRRPGVKAQSVEERQPCSMQPYNSTPQFGRLCFYTWSPCCKHMSAVGLGSACHGALQRLPASLCWLPGGPGRQPLAQSRTQQIGDAPHSVDWQSRPST